MHVHGRPRATRRRNRRVLVDVDGHGDAAGAERICVERAGADQWRKRAWRRRRGGSAGQLPWRSHRLARRIFHASCRWRSSLVIWQAGAAMPALRRDAGRCRSSIAFSLLRNSQVVAGHGRIDACSSWDSSHCSLTCVPSSRASLTQPVRACPSMLLLLIGASGLAGTCFIGAPAAAMDCSPTL
jgi:hypothetical protein